MPLEFSTAVIAIGVPVSKYLLKHFLGDPISSMTSGLVDIAAKKISSHSEQRLAQRQFEDLGDQIVKRLQPIFSDIPDPSAAAIAHEIGQTLCGNISARNFLDKDLDPTLLGQELRARRPLPPHIYSQSEEALYNRALDEAIRYIVSVAEQLPYFDSQSSSITLGRLTRLSSDIQTVLDKTARIESIVRSAKDNEAARTLRYEADYRQALLRKLDYLELVGVGAMSAGIKRHALSAGYVSLNIATQADVSQPFRAEDLLALLSTGLSRLLIRGHAGSGKSTLLRWIAITTAASTGSTWQERTWSDSLKKMLQAQHHSDVRYKRYPFQLTEFGLCNR
jgi:hypothetical protein